MKPCKRSSKKPLDCTTKKVKQKITLAEQVSAYKFVLHLIGNGYIPTSCLREILRELDDQLTQKELDMMIEEIDTDGSGTVDFDGKEMKICF